MPNSPLAGKPAPAELLIDSTQLQNEYCNRRPDVDDTDQLVSFGTSGHRGTPLKGTFTEAHILAITQAICDYRRGKGIDGPLYMGKDTHCLSGPAQRTALEVLAANGVEAVIQRDDGVTPTPVISRAILVHNRGGTDHLADGIVITPSHNPPADGGFKYNPPNGGPADTDVTRWIQDRANDYLLRRQRRASSACRSRRRSGPRPRAQEDFVRPYVDDLRNVIDMEAIRAAGLKLGVDPLGGAARALLGADQRGVRAEHQGRQPAGRSDVLVHDRRSRRQDPDGLLQPLRDGPAGRPEGPVSGRLRQRPRLRPARHRHALRGADESQPLPRRGHPLPADPPPDWPAQAAVGKTLVSSSMIDRVVAQARPDVCARCRSASSGSRRGCSTARAASAARRVPGPASCGATARSGRPTRTARSWTCWRRRSRAVTGKDPGEHYQRVWRPSSARRTTPGSTPPATPEQKARLQKLSPEARQGRRAGRASRSPQS